MLAQAHALTLCGLEVRPVCVEVDLAGGLPLFEVVGLPDASVRESRDRVRAGLRNSGFDFPMRRITVNLAPAGVRKVGAAFDLPIALGVLAATGQLPANRLAAACFAGELALSGQLRGVQGALCFATAPSDSSAPPLLVLPQAVAGELAGAPMARPVCLAGHIKEIVAWLRGGPELPRFASEAPPPPAGADLDLRDVQGQAGARRALEIAAAGRHHLLLSGPPGEGKTMLATRLPGIMPPPTPGEQLEIARIYSAAGLFPTLALGRRPMRSPHHGISRAGMVGSSAGLYPGEATLAHYGVLFLDEFSEFHTDTLAALRQPMEEKQVTLGRGPSSLRFPADFQVVAATNPCPCGWLGDERRKCSCTDGMLQRHNRRLNGPLLDRFDLFARVYPARVPDAVPREPGEASAAVRARVLAAWERQLRRNVQLAGAAHWANGSLPPGLLRAACRLDSAGESLLQSLAVRLALSSRAVDRVLRVARTCADLAGREQVSAADVAEAASYRQ